jgi:hypothetical protein
VSEASSRIDFSITQGWVTPEEWLYPQVQAGLSSWSAAHRPHHEVVRVVGERWSSRTHELRDALTRNTVPIGFYAVDSDAGARLTEEYGVETTRLPGGNPPRRNGAPRAEAGRGRPRLPCTDGRRSRRTT